MPLPQFPRYDRDALRPNAEVAVPEHPFPFAMSPQFVGHFGGWGARGDLVNGLPAPGIRAKGLGAGEKATNVFRDRVTRLR